MAEKRDFEKSLRQQQQRRLLLHSSKFQMQKIRRQIPHQHPLVVKSDPCVEVGGIQRTMGIFSIPFHPSKIIVNRSPWKSVSFYNHASVASNLVCITRTARSCATLQRLDHDMKWFKTPTTHCTGIKNYLWKKSCGQGVFLARAIGANTLSRINELMIIIVGKAPPSANNAAATTTQRWWDFQESFWKTIFWGEGMFSVVPLCQLSTILP